jgi:hypothetical protein
MMVDDGSSIQRRLADLRIFQRLHEVPVTDRATQSPAVALKSLNDALAVAPPDYRDYLVEAVACYEQGLYRAAILMVWAATVEYLYIVASDDPDRIKDLEAANFARFRTSRTYRQIKKKDDFLYLGEANWLQLAEDAGLMNRNARQMLIERLNLRNRCGHPTKYKPGREETVVFIESLLLNILSGRMLNR